MDSYNIKDAKNNGLMVVTNTFKIAIVGDSGVGKSTLIERHRTGNFNPTIGCDTHTLCFNTNFGRILLNMYEYSGQEKFDADGFIVMFDVTSTQSFKNAIKRISTQNPLILCGNKVDLKCRKVDYKTISSFIHQNDILYYDISARANYNFEKPFLHICKKLMKKDTLEFVSN